MSLDPVEEDAVLQTLVMTLLPDGGQRRARQNAWAARVDNAARARARREAEAALAAQATWDSRPDAGSAATPMAGDTRAAP